MLKGQVATNRAVCADDETIASIPGVAFNPIHAIQQGRSSTITSIAGVNSFNVSITTFLRFGRRSRQNKLFGKTNEKEHRSTFLLEKCR